MPIGVELIVSGHALAGLPGVLVSARDETRRRGVCRLG